MIYFLIVLIFVSKVSLAALGFFPKEIGPIIYQYGLHPYVNIFLNFTIGGFLSLAWFLKAHPSQVQSRFYRFILFLTSLYLIFITLLQCFFVNSDESYILQMGSAFMAVFTVFLYGQVIPTSFSPERFVIILKKICVFLCLLSFVVLFLSPSTSFKGTRFIGIFKHIPHMVSVATLACFGLYYFIFTQKMSRLKLTLQYFYLLIVLILLILTGTRSALASVLMGFFLCMILFRASSWPQQILKTAIFLSVFLIMVFFGHDLADYGTALIRGEQSLAQRTAQDGVKSRLEEVERGFEIFQKNQWLGQGILSKFSNGQEAEISQYNANKDPHNMFISAGVVGGWGLILMTFIAVITLCLACFKSLFSKNKALKLLAIYMLTQIPVILIYHIHLSLGGIADRIYWIVIGYVALKEIEVRKVNE